jgi:hypothetical protein
MAGFMGAATPEPVHAQAVCSAPHSSPTLAQSGSLRTLPPLAGWIQASVFGSRSTEYFGADGERQPFIGDSEFLTSSLFLSGAIGLVDGVEIWSQVPFHRLSVDSDGSGSTSTGLGDVRIAARIGSELFAMDVPLALRLGAKFPGSDFPVDPTVLPLTEGQRDWEVGLESVYRAPSRSLYLLGWVGYRWREVNDKARRDPGDEVFGHVALGGILGDLYLEVAGDALWGRAPTVYGFPLEGSARRMIQLQPTLGWQVGPGRLEATGQIPVRGENLPAGNALSLGYRLTWGLQESGIPDDFMDLLKAEKK